MKTIKKISTLFIASILAVVLFAMPAYALGHGEVTFSDPQAKSGEEVEVTAKMTCGGQLIGDGKLVLKYDPAYLEFIEGTGSRDASSGAVTLFNAGTGTETELNYTITFKALKEGETEITVTDSESYLWNDQTLRLTLGSSKVTIGAGGSSDGSSDTGEVTGDGPQVTIDGKQYQIVNDIPPAVVPQGFDTVKLNFNNQDINALQQEASGQKAVYATDGKEGALFLYEEEDGSFLPMELVDISESAYIILLKDDGTVNVPKGYEEVTLTFNDHSFPAWQNPDYEDYYLVYGLNSTGEKALYLYDKQDETFQRFNPDLLTKKKPATQKRNGWEGKILDFIEDHLKPCLIAMAALLFFMLILALVLGRKVHNRNVEIDDLYDELDGKRPPVPAAPKKSKKAKKGKKAKKAKKSKADKRGKSSPYDNYEEDYPMEEDLLDEDAFDAYEYDDYENDFSFEDDDDFLESETGHLPRKLSDTLANHKPLEADMAPRRPARRPAGSQSNQKFHVESDDDFKLDFIDLDD